MKWASSVLEFRRTWSACWEDSWHSFLGCAGGRLWTPDVFFTSEGSYPRSEWTALPMQGEAFLGSSMVCRWFVPRIIESASGVLRNLRVADDFSFTWYGCRCLSLHRFDTTRNWLALACVSVVQKRMGFFTFAFVFFSTSVCWELVRRVARRRNWIEGHRLRFSILVDCSGTRVKTSE